MLSEEKTHLYEKRRKSYYKIVLSFPLQGKSLLRSEFSLILSISSLPPLKKIFEQDH